MTEVLSGIFLIKVNCWESNFMAAVSNARKNEVRKLLFYAREALRENERFIIFQYPG